MIDQNINIFAQQVILFPYWFNIKQVQWHRRANKELAFLEIRVVTIYIFSVHVLTQPEVICLLKLYQSFVFWEEGCFLPNHQHLEHYLVNEKTATKHFSNETQFVNDRQPHKALFKFISQNSCKLLHSMNCHCTERDH